MLVLMVMDNFYDFGVFSVKCIKCITNVLLNGFHKLEKGNQDNAVLYQIGKKARLSS